MSNKYVFFVLVGIIVLLGAATGGSAYYANVLLQKQSNKIVALKLQDKDLSDQKTNLVRAQTDITKYASLENISQAIVPQDKDQAEAVREIVNIAQESGISLSSITFTASTLGQTQTVSGAGGVTKTIPSSATANKLTQVTPVVGIPGVYDLQINITQSSVPPVTYANFIAFLQRLEANRRTAQVSSITLQPDPKNPGVLTFTLSLDEYLKP